MTKQKGISFPSATFTDRFGAFARVYLSLMRIYTVPAGIPLHMRESIHNLWPLCLEPIGLAIEDLALIQSHSDTRIARGVITADLIRLENVLLIAFNIAKTGYMVQQNQNAGIAGHRNPTSFRVCMIDQLQNL